MLPDFFNDKNIDDFQSQLIVQKLSHKSAYELLYEILYRLVKPIFTLSVIIFGGSFISVIVVSMFNVHTDYIFKKLGFRSRSGSDTDSGSESGSESGSDADLDVQSKSAKYINKYMDEYNNLGAIELDKEYILTLKTKFIEDDTPDGIIQMNYDIDFDAFTYYINNKNIPYEYLETVGRLYIIENNCKTIFVDYKVEIEKSKQENIRILEEKEKEKEKEARDNEAREKTEEKKKSVFASFKIYKSKAENDTKNSVQLVLPEKANKYIYKGKLLDYEELINANKSGNDDFIHLDYSTYKNKG